MKYSLIVLMIFTANGVFAQDTLNRTDANGKKTGWWRIVGSKHNGMCENSWVAEEGRYDQGLKVGNWTSYYENGTKKLVMNHTKGQSAGKFVEYYKSGCPREEGTFKGMHYVGNYKMYWENGLIRQEKNFNEKGELDGKLVYRYINGNPEMEAGYSAGKPTQIIRYCNNGDIKEKTVYTDKGPETTSYTERTGPDLDLKSFELDCNANKLYAKTVVDTLNFETYEEEQKLPHDIHGLPINPKNLT
ncbi:MAG TPA: hypothetical protein VD905_20320, partial [Flavobacteriales bacterium]|nr:hypothetical protein [Flavobacteriales bacterium]